MKKIMIVALVTAMALSLSSCTDAARSNLMTYGSEAQITCYSGGEVIFSDTSTGKVSPIEGDGLSFRSKTTGKFVRAFADCILIDD